ncbi:MAG: HEAT repeat domain-containing protein [Ignavibacteriales bacterium]|nr:HEAT repeat domain-containing protein [Ignavibacteriales bacterium]
MSSAMIHEQIEILKKGDDETRENAIEALGNIGPDAILAVPLIIAAIKEDNLCWAATTALGKIGGKDATQALCHALLTDKDAGVQIRAAESLGRIGDSASLPSLIKALENPYEVVRAVVIEELAIVGDKTIEPIIKKVLNDSSQFVRESAAKAMTTLNNKAIKKTVSNTNSEPAPPARKSWLKRLFKK